MKIPDYISPVIGHRVWWWDETGLKSLNGEPWLPDRPVEARCRFAPATRHMRVAEPAKEVPDRDCTCGIYAAKNVEHLRRVGYADRGICGEVYLWGTVVEHELGWRAQFAYPKSLVLPLHMLPFTLAGLDVRLGPLVPFGTDIFVLRNGESVRLWKHGAGYDAGGLDHIISVRAKHYLRQKEERSLRKGDRVALVGHGIAVVQQAEDKVVVIVLGSGDSLQIARKNIILNRRNMRWECEATPNRCAVESD